MLNYGRERLNSMFSITITRNQHSRRNKSELKNFNDNNRIKYARLSGFMWNYGHDLLNSRTQRYFSSQDCSTHRVHAKLWA